MTAKPVLSRPFEIAQDVAWTELAVGEQLRFDCDFDFGGEDSIQIATALQSRFNHFRTAGDVLEFRFVFVLALNNHYWTVEIDHRVVQSNRDFFQIRRLVNGERVALSGDDNL